MGIKSLFNKTKKAITRPFSATYHYFRPLKTDAPANEVTLLSAVESNSKETVSTLLAGGADIHTQNEMPLRIAMKNRQSEMAFFLMENGANAEAALAYARMSSDSVEKVNIEQWFTKAEPHVKKIVKKQLAKTQALKSTAN